MWVEKSLGDGMSLRFGSSLLFAYKVNSKKGTSSWGLELSKGVSERLELVRLTIANKRAFSQVVPDFGLEARMMSWS